MIGCFPPAHPDELFYSLCARYAERTRYPVPYSVNLDLLGTRNAVGIDLPTRLDFLVSALPPKDPRTVDQFIDENSLLPFYGPFLPPDRLNTIREEMRSIGASIYVRLGSVAALIDPPKYLRLCEQCVAQDRAHVGEAYWHRSHQIPGVFICPVHEILLEDTPILRQTRLITDNECFSAESALKLQPLSPSRKQLPGDDIFLALAKDAAWLLNQRGLATSFHTFKTRYRSALESRNLIDPRGARYDRLLKSFQEHYQDSTLEFLQCPLVFGKGGTWLHRLVRLLYSGQHPLRHLLVIRWLGLTAETFFSQQAQSFNLPPQQSPFGSGPWPCLNPACIHYRQLVIRTVRLSVEYFGNSVPYGFFACTCGFEYWRKGPDRQAMDQFRADGVKKRGLVWEALLRKLWADPANTKADTAKVLDVSRSTIDRQAQRLGLLVPSDKPPRRSEIPKIQRDWEVQDQEQSRKIRKIARQLKSRPGQPVRITVWALRREIGRPELKIDRRNKNLPLTFQAVDDVVESVSEFEVRKIQWAAQRYAQEHRYPKRQEFLAQARVSINAKTKPQVKTALADALSTLANSHLVQKWC